MAFATPDTPNLADFQFWLTTSVAIPASAWPNSDITQSIWPQYALEQALALVLTGQGAIPGNVYTLATYNCATALLFLIAGDTPPSTYFADARSNQSSANFPNGGFGLMAPITGLVVASSDENTSATLTAPDWAAGLTVDQLGFYRTIWGRWYLAYIQKFGPTTWGLT